VLPLVLAAGPTCRGRRRSCSASSPERPPGPRCPPAATWTGSPAGAATRPCRPAVWPS